MTFDVLCVQYCFWHGVQIFPPPDKEGIHPLKLMFKFTLATLGSDISKRGDISGKDIFKEH